MSAITQPLICPVAGRTVPLAATRIYQMSFFTGFIVSSLIYYLLNVLFPVPGVSKKFEETDVSEFSYDRHGVDTRSVSDVESSKGKDEKDEKTHQAVYEAH